MAARRTERFTDQATIPRQARTASPIKPSMAPTAIKTVPSGVFVVCKYGAPAVGGTVTTGAAVEVDDEDVDVVVVETDDDVVVELSVEEEEEVSDVEVAVVESMLVDVSEDSDEVVTVFSVDVVEVGSVVAAVVSVTLGVLSVVEGSSVVWAASVVASAVLSSFFCADAQATMKTSRNKTVNNFGWAFPSLGVKSRMMPRP